MKQLALAPVKPVSTVETIKTGRATAHVVDRPVIMDVKVPQWYGYARGKAHAYLVPVGDGPLGKAVCGKSLDLTRLTKSDGERCKSCASLTAEDKRKRGTGLVDRTVDVVATGAQDGDTRDAEKRRQCEIAEISGNAAKINAETVENLRAGRKGVAIDKARQLDRRGPAAPVPAASCAPIGQRDHGMLDGVAMVRGRNMEPVQAQRGWAAAAGTMWGSLGRERADREIVGDGKPTARRSNASKRRHRKSRTIERQVAARLARQSNKG